MQGLILALAFGAVGTPVVEPNPENPFVAVRRVENTPPGGSALFLDGKVLYCGSGLELDIYDVSVPLSPRLISAVRGIGHPRQIVARGGWVFVSARETGVWVVDARDPKRAKVVTRFDTIELATGLELAGDVLFVGQRVNGVEFVDVSDRAHPAHIGIEKTEESQSVVYRDGYLYSGEWGAGCVTVIDVHDMSKVRTLGTTRLSGFGDGVATLGRALFAATGHHRHDPSRTAEENHGRGHGVEIFDLADPAKPRRLARADFPPFFSGGRDWWTPRPSADGKTVFVADTHNGLFAVDMTDVLKPRVIGRITIENGDRRRGARIPGEAFASVAVGDSAVYFACEGYGLGVVACSRAKAVRRKLGVLPKNSSYRMPYPTPEDSRFTAWLPPVRVQVRGAAAYGRYLYVACGAGGLSVLEADAGGVPRFVKKLSPRFCADVKAKDGTLYSAEDVDGLALYDLADPLSPREMARCRDFSSACEADGLDCALWVWKPSCKYIVVSNRGGGYYFLDPTDPKKMKTVGCFGICPGWDRYIADDVVGGRYLAIQACNAGFLWVDVSGDRPVQAAYSRVNKSGQNDGCIAFRGDRLLRMSHVGMQFLSPGQPENADGTPWAGLKEFGTGRGQPVWDGKDRLAVTTRINRRVWMCDIADENSQKPLLYECLTGQPDTATFWNGRLVIPCGYQGLLVEKKK